MEQYNSKVVLNALFQGKKAVLTTTLGTVQLSSVGSTFYVTSEENGTEVMNSVGLLNLLDEVKNLVNKDYGSGEFKVSLELK